jgi:5-methylcytosine-specific restriction protein A
MPDRPWRPCAQPGCPELVKAGYCPGCQARRPGKLYDDARGNSNARGYGRRWRKFRLGYLSRHPICQATMGCDQPASEPHHIVRVECGGAMYDERNLQALCKSHHSSLRGAGGRL